LEVKMLKLVGTVIMFIMTVYTIGMIFSRVKTGKTNTIRDVIEKAEDGVASNIVYVPGLDLEVENYVCGGFECEERGIEITNESIWNMETGRIYMVSGEPCDGKVCITVKEGGNSG